MPFGSEKKRQQYLLFWLTFIISILVQFLANTTLVQREIQFENHKRTAKYFGRSESTRGISQG